MPTVNELLGIAKAELTVVHDILKDMNGTGFLAEINYSLALYFSIILRQII